MTDLNKICVKLANMQGEWLKCTFIIELCTDVQPKLNIFTVYVHIKHAGASVRP